MHPDSPDRDSEASWKQLLEWVSPFLHSVREDLQHDIRHFDTDIADLAGYALESQGKQLRPMLVGLAALSTGGLRPEHVQVAAIVEMVHLATLVHDDIMDEADFRRQRPTLSAKWGQDLAVLTGDCLFAEALEKAAAFPTPEVCRLVAGASKSVCTGEILQNRSRWKSGLGQDTYFKIIQLKTAELFSLCCRLAAWVNQSSPEQTEAYRIFGDRLGTAYQIYDDCVDLFDCESNAGKSLGRDLSEGKLTLPVLELLRILPVQEKEQVLNWIAQWDGSKLDELLALMKRRQIPERVATRYEAILKEADEALGSHDLDPLPPLRTLSLFLRQQFSNLMQHAR